jgi:hypothetical protein
LTEPEPAEKTSEKLRGCVKNGILGCGSLLLVFLVMATLVVSLVSRHPDRYRSVVGKLFDAFEDEIAQSFDSEVSAADRAAFARARERFRIAWNAGELPPSAADRLRRRLLADSRKGRFGASDVRSLTDFLDQLSTRRNAPAPAPRPAATNPA